MADTRNISMPSLSNATANTPLSSGTYQLLAALAAIIGLASSFVTARFFVLGLERLEPDSLARESLIAAGMLMIVTELAAFGLAALLPKAQFRQLRWRLMMCGALLLGFEASTIYLTQVTLVKSSAAYGESVTSRIGDLRAGIESRRAAAEGLRANGARQSDSKHGTNRAAGAVALRQALDAERQIEPMAVELSRLLAAKTPTLEDALGEQGMLAYSVARAMLISAMGVVMFAAAGTLLRFARSASAGAAVIAVTAVAAVAPTVAVAGARLTGVAPITPRTPSRLKSFAIAGAPFAAIGFGSMGYVAPTVLPPVTGYSLTGVAPTTAGAAVADAPVTQLHSVSRQSRPVAADESQSPDEEAPDRFAVRYSKVKSGVLDGSIKPSVRGIQSATGGGTLSVRRFLQQLAAEGVLEPHGRGWVKATNATTNIGAA
jgi:hypothetical protein